MKNHAPYHQVKTEGTRPTAGIARKADLQGWLTGHHLDLLFKPDMVKAEQWQLVQLGMPAAKYHVDELV